MNTNTNIFNLIIFLPSHYHTLSPPAGEGDAGGGDAADHHLPLPPLPPRPLPPPGVARQTERQNC